MNIYHIWCDLKPGTLDTDFIEAVVTYLDHLKSKGTLEDYRITRRKLGLGTNDLGEFHFMLDFTDLAALDAAFAQVAERADPVESFHFAVNRHATNLKFALYRDFPDDFRKKGEEKF